MTVTSLGYYALLLVGIALYYTLPKQGQWVILFLLSMAFYLRAAPAYTILFLLASAFLAYVAGMAMDREGANGLSAHRKTVAGITVAVVVLNILLWFLLKGSSFWMVGSRLIHHIIPAFPQLPALPIAGALGMGYYTAQVIGYIIDCYWGTIKPQRNFLKLFLFVSFFPQLTVGPISRYSQLECLYEKHRFSYQNLCFGAQRILWGVFKKLVISDRVGLIISGIWADTGTFGGVWPWVAVFLYPLQIYTDFSGCMDIVLGSAELFDIHMPENFKNPFFSRSVQEFWQRWHITLGAWAKDYVYYPVLKSKPILAIGKWARKHFNKKTAKKIPWLVGMAVLWFVMGFWHGSMRHIAGVSAWFWTMLVASELCAPLMEKATARLHINTESTSWILFQRVRTYVIYSLGCVFFSADSLTHSIDHVKTLAGALGSLTSFQGTIAGLGVTDADMGVIAIGVLALVIVAILREKYGYARTWMQGQILPFRWAVWLLLFIITVLCGMYGPGFNAQDFIYEQF